MKGELWGEKSVIVFFLLKNKQTFTWGKQQGGGALDFP